MTSQLRRKAVNLANPNSLAAIVRKTSFDISLTKFLQTRFTPTEPAAVQLAIESDGLPQTPDEMEWQLELLKG